MKKPAWIGSFAVVAVMAGAGGAQAQVTQSVNLGAGYFMARGEESRHADDVLLEDLQSLAFEVKDFNGGLLQGEWLIGFGDRVEFGLGAGFYQRTVPSVYANFVDSDGSEIEQDLKLRIVPITGTVKFLPFGRAGDFQPYVGGGAALLNWKYSEVGEFVDFTDGAIFRDQYVASGSTVAPIVFGGLRVPISGDVFAFNGEVRWQGGKGDLGADSGLLTDTIDLGGISLIGSVQIRF